MEIIWLDHPRASETALTGGKVAALARLAAHHPVPRGFCVTALAFARTGGALTPDLEAAIRTAYAQFGPETAVAVRSSGIDEDGAGASLAGQHETYLNLTGPDAVLDAVRRCWESAFSERAQAYRAERGLAAVAPLAVLVQELVAADSSGVAFSLDPVTGAPEVLINAAFGLGESVVGGTVTPDSYRVERSTLTLLRSEAAEKMKMTVAIPGGTKEVDVPKFLRRKPALTTDQAVQVARLAVALEAEMAHPVDLEFAYQGDSLYLLQCRPITSLPAPIEPPADFPVTWEQPDDVRLHWRRDRTHWPLPVPALFASFMEHWVEAWNRGHARYESPRFYAGCRYINGYLYFSMGNIFKEMPAYREHPPAAMASRLADPYGTWERELLPEVQSLIARLDAPDLETAPLSRLAGYLDTAREGFIETWDIHARIVVLMSAGGEFTRLHEELFGKEDPIWLAQMYQGFDNHTLRMNRTLRALSLEAQGSEEVRAAFAHAGGGHAQSAAGPAGTAATLAALERSVAGRAFLAHFRRFLDEYGHRFEMWDFTVPSWLEDATPPLQAIRDYMEQDAAHDPLADLAALEQEREQAVERARQQLAGYPAPVRERYMRGLQTDCRTAQLNEDHNFWVDYKAQAAIGRIVRGIGRRLAAAGLIADAEDVRHLTLAEIRESLLEGRPRHDLAAARRAELAHWATVSEPHELGTKPPPPPDAPAPQAPAPDSRTLKGTPVSPGVVRGAARILRTLSDGARLQRGEILVAVSTSPPWTPLFAKAAAVVTETGGPLSHSAIVTREFRKPGVAGAAKATTAIRDGQLIEVDGTRGTVTLLD